MISRDITFLESVHLYEKEQTHKEHNRIDYRGENRTESAQTEPNNEGCFPSLTSIDCHFCQSQ